jgi:SAM-dependent methyltransferase
MSRTWQEFWGRQDDPRHPRNIPDFFLLHGRELSLVVGDPAGKRVLELGCGSGSLFTSVGFDEASSYRGVDFSESMLAVFRAAFPAVNTVCAEASSYSDNAKYDVIFSNAVVQYFDRRMLRRHIANAARMLAPRGKLIIGSIPWRGARASFHLHAYSQVSVRKILRGFAVLGRSYLGVDPIGYWHSYREFHLAAQAHGLTATIFGCIQYPYRFHVRMEHST